MKFDSKILSLIQCQGNKWSVETLQLKHEKHETIVKWKKTLDHILEKTAQIQKRPSKLLIFINPFGGKSEAVRIHKNQVNNTQTNNYFKTIEAMIFKTIFVL